MFFGMIRRGNRTQFYRVQGGRSNYIPRDGLKPTDSINASMIPT